MTLAIIQARLGSSRFPRKALALLHGKTVIEHVADRVLKTRGLRYVVLACPPADALTFRELFPFMVCSPDVPESDVLARYAQVASAYAGVDTILRVTGDCPLWNPRIAEDVLKLYFSSPGVEYASNIAEGYTDGEDCEVFSVKALEWAQRSATDPYDREHVTPWIRRHVKCVTPETGKASSGKTSIDTMEDLERVRALMAVA
jgi:spore coat polysaccharide biosynthesis protein SpsF (cytidylyltransferase family)